MENQPQESMKKTWPAMAGSKLKSAPGAKECKGPLGGGKAGPWILRGKSTAQQTRAVSPVRTFSDF